MEQDYLEVDREIEEKRQLQRQRRREEMRRKKQQQMLLRHNLDPILSSTSLQALSLDLTGSLTTESTHISTPLQETIPTTPQLPTNTPLITSLEALFGGMATSAE